MSSEQSDPLPTLAQRIPLKGAKRRTRISIPGSAFTTAKRILVGERRTLLDGPILSPLGKTCGNTGISRDKICHVRPGCACDG